MLRGIGRRISIERKPYILSEHGSLFSRRIEYSRLAGGRRMKLVFNEGSMLWAPPYNSYYQHIYALKSKFFDNDWRTNLSTSTTYPISLTAVTGYRHNGDTVTIDGMKYPTAEPVYSSPGILNYVSIESIPWIPFSCYSLGTNSDNTGDTRYFNDGLFFGECVFEVALDIINSDFDEAVIAESVRAATGIDVEFPEEATKEAKDLCATLESFKNMLGDSCSPSRARMYLLRLINLWAAVSEICVTVTKSRFEDQEYLRDFFSQYCNYVYIYDYFFKKNSGIADLERPKYLPALYHTFKGCYHIFGTHGKDPYDDYQYQEAITLELYIAQHIPFWGFIGKVEG